MAVVEDKISFILYGSYEEQLDMLTDEQTGKLFKAIYVYARTGEKHSDDPMVAMMLSVISHQMDIDARKYAEKKERLRAAGRKGGKQKAENMAKANETVANASHATNCVANLAVDVDDDVDVYVDVDEDVDVLDINKQQQRQEDEVVSHVCEKDIITDDNILSYGKNQIPTTPGELQKIRSFAEELFARYHTKKATNMDVERVFENVYRSAYNSKGEGYAVLDRSRADLLEFAFHQASVQDQVKWSYIDTILDKYRKNNISTAAQAQEYEYSRKRGEVA